MTHVGLSSCTIDAHLQVYAAALHKVVLLKA